MGRGGEGEQRRTDLVAALATLDGDDLTHGVGERWCNGFRPTKTDSVGRFETLRDSLCISVVGQGC